MTSSVCISFKRPLSLSLSLAGRHVPPSRTSAEACLTGWPNAQPGGRDEYSVAGHHRTGLTVCVVCSCCASYLLVKDSASPLACSLVRARSREREACIRAQKGTGEGSDSDRLCV